MGDRANWGFVESFGKPVINLYTHWEGYRKEELLANALEAARPRWDDPSYATRIVISQIIGDEWGNETGWGITVDALGDNEHDYLLVYWETQQVVRVPLSWQDTGESGLQTVWTKAPEAKVASFEDFIRVYSSVGRVTPQMS